MCRTMRDDEERLERRRRSNKGVVGEGMMGEGGKEMIWEKEKKGMMKEGGGEDDGRGRK